MASLRVGLGNYRCEMDSYLMKHNCASIPPHHLGTMLLLLLLLPLASAAGPQSPRGEATVLLHHVPSEVAASAWQHFARVQQAGVGQQGEAAPGYSGL